MASTADRLQTMLDTVANRLADLIAFAQAEREPPQTGMFVFIRPRYSWRDLSAEQNAVQIEISRMYAPAAEVAKRLLKDVHEELHKRFESADEAFRVWLDFDSNWSLTGSPPENQRAMRKSMDDVLAVLKILSQVGAPGVILVPDTNALIAECDPVQYRVMASSSFTFLLLPTVLAELDKLKVEHRNTDVRDKAERAVKRIKGWRDQGSLRTGVTVDKTITVRADHVEPDMKNTLSWLDSANSDDRIVASVVAVQAANPAARVVLVTRDINLQNKADAALIEVAEL